MATPNPNRMEDDDDALQVEDLHEEEDTTTRGSLVLRSFRGHNKAGDSGTGPGLTDEKAAAAATTTTTTPTDDDKDISPMLDPLNPSQEEDIDAPITDEVYTNPEEGTQMLRSFPGHNKTGDSGTGSGLIDEKAAAAAATTTTDDDKDISPMLDPLNPSQEEDIDAPITDEVYTNPEEGTQTNNTNNNCTTSEELKEAEAGEVVRSFLGHNKADDSGTGPGLTDEKAAAAATTTTTTTDDDDKDISPMLDPLNPSQEEDIDAPITDKVYTNPEEGTQTNNTNNIYTTSEELREAEAGDVPTPLPSSSSFSHTKADPDAPTPPTRTPVCPLWTRVVEDGLHDGIRRAVTGLATHAARNPWTCVVSVVLFSFGIAAVGACTNFVVYFDSGSFFTPTASAPAEHGQWYYEESGFVDSSDLMMIVHADGDNVLNRAAVAKAFEVLDTLMSVDGYAKVCAQSDYQHPITNDHTCWIWSVTQFWENNRTAFEEHHPSTLELVQAFSQPVFPNGIPLFADALFGALERVNISQTDRFREVMDGMDINQTIHDVWNTTKEWYGHHGLSAAEDLEYLSYAPAFMISVGFPDIDATYEFQERALLELQDLREKWALEDSDGEDQQHLRLDFFCGYAYSLEYQRALVRDMPLVLIIFMVMLVFTMFVFHKHGRHPGAPLWKSRASLGLASVITIGMSLLSGFGMLFCWGVPFTNICLMAPFVILGIGLDDTFIITGAYFRRLREFHARQRQQLLEQQQPPKKKETSNNVWNNDKVDSTKQPDRKQQQEEVVKRIEETMKEVGLSVSLTTMTTTVAFVLGCVSTIPGIRWLCMYASVTIVFDFFYQISFFIALLVLDERRVAGTLLTREQDGEYPEWLQCLMNYCCCCCCWCCCCCGFQVEPPQPRSRGSSATQFNSAFGMPEQALPEETLVAEEEFFMDRIMRCYAKVLLRPVVKVVVILAFLAAFGCNVYSTTRLEQRFNLVDYVPEDSYTRPFFQSMRDYSKLVVPMAVYFRNVNQSDEEIQMQMIDYVNEISELPQIGRPPEFCWVRDLHMLFEAGADLEEKIRSSETFGSFGEHATQKLVFLLDTLHQGNFTFDERLNLVLKMPGLRDIYGEDIVRDEDGTITASRCFIYMRNIDLQNVHQQVNALHDTREVTMQQPINQLPGNQDELPFFAYEDLFAMWQLYTVAISELINTTIMGVVAVCIVGFVMIPNWSAVLFVGPLIVMLYFNLLGTMQACGIYINAVTYVTVVIAIGLLVDFLMHILLRYFETTATKRETKVKVTLETMGASIMLGGFTTFLGVIPMAFSTTKIFYTLFIAFLAMASWGVLVGLVLLPVLLSIWGPEITTSAPPVPEDDTSCTNSGRKGIPQRLNSATEESETAYPHTGDSSRDSEASLGGAYGTPLSSPMPSLHFFTDAGSSDNEGGTSLNGSPQLEIDC